MYGGDVLKLVIAALLGIVLGLERELKRKPLGLKTCLIISITSCLLTIVSIDSTLVPSPVAGIVHSDPMRLAAQIVSGIGFLGAGVILRKSNEVISGITTAAMVWASSGLGIAVGVGFYIDALIGLFLIIISVELVPIVMRRIGPQALREKEVEITLVATKTVNLNQLTENVSVLQTRVEKIKTKELKDQTREITIHCIVDQSVKLTELFSSLDTIDGILSIDAQSL